ncbi:NAD(P)/FAD-dependent oxidoreductase [Nonomuraea pusilla]|uniref:Glycine/D-amino acid oxidase n=1 Tax=Nonomuraea pusilla TaxID=46177 RepID=A0A1H7Y8V1_9ACTN|nr:FAD-dependent oxidoreductase [Nonomuraea pusilla]SEM42560.1 Glycine/D-amino acid oxidase [Nonomuraea pusilla]
MAAYDVAIIGAGVHGASAAMHVAARGARVVVLERATPASGPTGQSSAVVRGYYVNEFLARLTRDSIDLFHGFTDWTHGGQAGFVTTGALFLHAEEDGPQMRRTVERLDAQGIRTELIPASGVAADFPGFDLAGIGWGAWEPDAGHADPVGTTLGMLERARQLGAQVRSDCPVVAVEPSGKAVRLRTAGGEHVTAERVLLAAGPWTGELLARVGVVLPLHAERHIVATFGWGGAEPLPYVWASIPDGIYAKPEHAGQFLVGTLWEEPAADPDRYESELWPEEHLRVVEPAVRRVPRLAEATATSGYAALYDVAPDWQPVIGEVADRVTIVAGTAGHGFKWAPALGAHVADLLTGEPGDPALEQFSPARFARGSLLGGGYGKARILG